MMSNKLNEQFRQIDELLKSARRVLVASHENPDPDAVVSVLLIHNFLKNSSRFGEAGKGFKPLAYLPDNPPKYLNFLPGFFEIKTDISFFKPDVIFGLDYGDFKRLRIPDKIIQENSPKIITIDHHIESDQKGDIKIIEPGISSTAEIIYYLLKYWGVNIDKDVAYCILNGIFSDTGGLKHVSTSSKTFRIVSELLLKGVSLNKIVRCTLAFQKSVNLSKAWGKVLARTELEEKTGLAYSWISAEDLNKFGVSVGDFDGIANLISDSSPRNLSLFLIERQPGKIKGSLRSELLSRIDVVKIARPLGGGGHSYAASFQQEGTIDGVLKKVIDLIK